MCGIVGWIARDGIDPKAIDRALETLNRRGPDGSGRWVSPDGRVCLGHRRLAILDPSVRGEEPSIAPDRGSAFIHNGEIYNYRELRASLEREGETFVSTSDGEVAHRLLRKFGAQALGRIGGMFALALWNQQTGRLLLARDRLGIKPLYYAALSRRARLRVRAEGAAGAARHVRPPRSRRSFGLSLVRLRAVRPLHVRGNPEASAGPSPAVRFRLRRPPRGTLLETGAASVRDDPEELRHRLQNAVRTHLVSDVPLGAFFRAGSTRPRSFPAPSPRSPICRPSRSRTATATAATWSMPASRPQRSERGITRRSSRWEG